MVDDGRMEIVWGMGSGSEGTCGGGGSVRQEELSDRFSTS